MFEMFKEWQITKEVEEAITPIWINMVFDTCHRYAANNNFDVEPIQHFEIYKFIKDDMRIIGFEHICKDTYTRVELRNDTLEFPFHNLKVVVEDNGNTVLMSIIHKKE